MAEDHCVRCGARRTGDARFCEVCGHGYPVATGPARAGAGWAPSEQDGSRWVAEVQIDPAWYADQVISEPLPARQDRRVVELGSDAVLVGRLTRHDPAGGPLIDCEPDPGVSRRHARLSLDDQHWWLEDLSSANGSYLGDDAPALPVEPIRPGVRHPIRSTDRIYLGAWTKITVRQY